MADISLPYLGKSFVCLDARTVLRGYVSSWEATIAGPGGGTIPDRVHVLFRDPLTVTIGDGTWEHPVEDWLGEIDDPMAREALAYIRELRAVAGLF